jgi:hypothetical protein
MSTQGQSSQAASPVYRTERVIASLVMAWVIILTTYMIFQDHALSHASMYFLKIILSLSGAVMLATLPGFMDVNYTVGGFSVRAAGGAAAFVFIYTQSPNLPVLRLDPAQARPAQQRQPAPKSDNLSQLTDGYPTLMAFSLVAPGVLFASAPSNGAGAQSGGFEAGVNINTPENGGAPLTGGLGGISLAEAVSTDAVAVLATVSRYARTAAQELRRLLDAAATALRGGVSRIAATVGDLLGALKALGGAPRHGIALVSENLSERTDELVSGLFGPGGAPAGALLDQLNGLTTGLLGGLQNSADGIASTVGSTVQTLSSVLQGTTHTVLDSTEKLAHGVTDVLDDATGGLTSGLSPAANRIVSGITSTTGRAVDGITPAVANTASQVLDGVSDRVGELTERLNAVSPALIATIDPDFAAGRTLLQLPDRLETVGSAPLLEKLGGPLDKLGSEGEHGLLGSLGERHLFANKFADPLGGEALKAEPTCIGGCGGRLLSGGGGSLSESVSGLGAGQGRLLGSLNGGGPASGSLASGGSIGGGPAAGPGGGSASQGPISSAVGTTRSVLGGATKLIGRR